MNRLNKSATFQVVIPSAISGLILLLTLPVAQAAPIVLDGGVVHDQTGSIAEWNIDDVIIIGDSSEGTLNITAGGRVTTTTGYIGNNAGSNGTVLVSGIGSQWSNSDNLYVGYFGSALLTIADGGVVNNVNGSVGRGLSNSGAVTVTGSGSQWNNSGDLNVGSLGELIISGGGIASSTAGSVGGKVTVAGAGSQWNMSDTLTVNAASDGNGELIIADGGAVSNVLSQVSVNSNSEDSVTVTGNGSLWTMSGQLQLGYLGKALLTIADGGVVSNTASFLGVGYRASDSVSGRGVVTVTGAGSRWNNSGALYVGYAGNGEVTVADGGLVTATSLTLARDITTTGTLNIGAASGYTAVAPGSIETGNIYFGAGDSRIVFNHTDTSGSYLFAPKISGEGNLAVYSGTTVLTGANSYSGLTTVYGGTLTSAGIGTFSRNSDYITQAGGTLNLGGYDQTLKSLEHSGMLNFGGIGGNTLTIAGDYIGNNGLLNMNSVLQDDDSVTDKLIIGGNTSGNTFVQVNNLGGSGAQTLNGIELISVGGLSDGEFIQQGRIIAGAYDYALERGIGSNNANWYLSSAISPEEPGLPELMVERPEASGYSANLAAANNMFVTRLHDRLGETRYIDALTGEQKVTSLWLRNEGGHNRSRDSQDQLRTQSNRYVMQLGGDIAQWSQNGADRFHLGLMAGYGNSKSTTESRLSGYSARASVDGYSTGVYGTWYANSADKTGLYVDSWAQYSWFNNTVNGQDLAVEEYKSKGVTASVESGYTFKVGENVAKNASYFIQPKAQVTWMGVKADDHKEANGTNVSGEGNSNIQTRLGVKAFMNSYADQDKGKDRVFQPFVEANWIHNTKDFGTTMDGVTVKQAGAANIAELKLGVEGQLSKKVNVWGNVGQQVGNKGYSDTAVMLGVKYNF